MCFSEWTFPKHNFYENGRIPKERTNPKRHFPKTNCRTKDIFWIGVSEFFFLFHNFFNFLQYFLQFFFIFHNFFRFLWFFHVFYDFPQFFHVILLFFHELGKFFLWSTNSFEKYDSGNVLSVIGFQDLPFLDLFILVKGKSRKCPLREILSEICPGFFCQFFCW